MDRNSCKWPTTARCLSAFEQFGIPTLSTAIDPILAFPRLHHQPCTNNASVQVPNPKEIATVFLTRLTDLGIKKIIDQIDQKYRYADF